jgi:uncharacterized protein YndB with AHSA1/START domain
VNSDNTIELRTTPEHLWPLLVDPAQIRRWNPEVVRDEPLTPGPPGVGSTSAVWIREGRREVRYESEVLTFDPLERLVIRLTGGSLGEGPMLVSYAVSPSSSADHLTLRVTGSWQPVGWVLRLLAPLLGILARRNSRAALERLRQLAEAES